MVGYGEFLPVIHFYIHRRMDSKCVHVKWAEVSLRTQSQARILVRVSTV